RTHLQRVALQITEKLPSVVLQVEKQWDWSYKSKNNGLESGYTNFYNSKKLLYSLFDNIAYYNNLFFFFFKNE
ncbi:MAG: hypothetical protein LBE31_11300, partial [Deltaproteobacteria bacterium]|nr:hypothetical protein [Deltaproteobacteria bacterium]